MPTTLILPKTLWSIGHAQVLKLQCCVAAAHRATPGVRNAAVTQFRPGFANLIQQHVHSPPPKEDRSRFMKRSLVACSDAECHTESHCQQLEMGRRTQRSAAPPHSSRMALERKCSMRGGLASIGAELVTDCPLVGTTGVPVVVPSHRLATVAPTG